MNFQALKHQIILSQHKQQVNGSDKLWFIKKYIANAQKIPKVFLNKSIRLIINENIIHDIPKEYIQQHCTFIGNREIILGQSNAIRTALMFKDTSNNNLYIATRIMHNATTYFKVHQKPTLEFHAMNIYAHHIQTQTFPLLPNHIVYDLLMFV